MYHVSNRALTDMKLAVKAEQEEIAKRQRTKQRRAERTSHISNSEKEKAFVLGLIDCCPRCGEEFEDYPDEEMTRLHLLNCTDENKHETYKRKLEKKQKSDLRKEEKANMQLSVQANAAWEFLGSKSSQLWLLDEVQLRKIALEKNLDVSGDKEELVSKIIGSEEDSGIIEVLDQAIDDKNQDMQSGKKMRIDSSTRKSTNDENNAIVVKKKTKISADELPSNLYSLSLAELKVICASYRIPVSKGILKSDIIASIEELLYEE
jgi:hypothetical protein